MNWDPLNTWPTFVQARFNDVRLKIYAAEGPNYWGSPQMWMMLYLSGIYHCAFSIIARKPSPYALVYAFFICATKNRTLKEMTEISGNKIYDYNIGKSSHSQTTGAL